MPDSTTPAIAHQAARQRMSAAQLWDEHGWGLDGATMTVIVAAVLFASGALAVLG